MKLISVIPVMQKMEDAMNVKNIAELIMLQCVEDLWDVREERDSRKFFQGKRFQLCAEIANMSQHDQSQLLHMVSKVMDQTTTSQRKPRSIEKGLPALQC